METFKYYLPWLCLLFYQRSSQNARPKLSSKTTEELRRKFQRPAYQRRVRIRNGNGTDWSSQFDLPFLKLAEHKISRILETRLSEVSQAGNYVDLGTYEQIRGRGMAILEELLPGLRYPTGDGFRIQWKARSKHFRLRRGWAWLAIGSCVLRSNQTSGRMVRIGLEIEIEFPGDQGLVIFTASRVVGR